MSLLDGEKVHSPTAAEVIHQARAKLLELYPNDTPSYLQKFQSCAKPEEIINILEGEIKNFKTFREDRWKPIRAKIRPIVAILLQIVNVAKGSATSHIPGGNSIFAGLCVLLAATQAQSEKYDILEKLFTKFEYFLLRFDRLYRDKSHSSRELLDEMSARILAHFFHCITVSIMFIQKGRFRHWLWGVFGLPDEIKVELQKMEELTNEEGLIMNAEVLINIEDLKRILVDQNIKDWIAAPDPSQERNIALSERLKVGGGEVAYFTGSWILDDDIFVNWKEWKGNPILWLYGPSGSGKTVICATIIDHLKTIGATVEFFFNNRSNVNGKQSMTGMVSSFLEQLATTHPKRLEALRQLHELHSKDSLGSASSLSHEAQIKCIRDMLSIEMDSRVFLVVDAIDEHPKYNKDSNGEIRDRAKLLEFLNSLSDYPTVRLLVTSRDEPDIRKALERRDLVQYNIGEAPEQRENIRTYIALRMASEEPFTEWPESKVDLIWEKFSEETMFRLISLQLDNLKKNVLPKDIQATLDALPKTLDEMYAKILKEMVSTPNTFHTIIRAFELIYSAARPLYIEELAEVFATNSLSDVQVRIIAVDRLKNPAKEVLEICSSAFTRLEGNLDRIGKWDPERDEKKVTVHFAHASVLDFLQFSTSSPFQLKQENASVTLSRLCISALIRMLEYPDDKHPLHDYVCCYLFEDIERASKLNLGLMDGLKDLLDRISLDAETIRHSTRTSCAHWTNDRKLFDLASFLGLTDYVERILKLNNMQISTAALHAAAARGNCNILERLIVHGGLASDRSPGCTAMIHATWGGHFDAVCLLLKNGANVEEPEERGYNPDSLYPLRIAVSHNFLGIAEVLLKHGADVRSRICRRSPLDFAAGAGHLEMSSLLIDHILKIDAPDDSFRSSLCEAAFRGRLSMVQLLLAHFPQLINVQGLYQSTPLHAVIPLIAVPEKENLENRVAIMKLLLSRGANTLMTDSNGWTPLHKAVFYGDLEIVQLLVEHNEAAFYVQDNKGYRPLRIAIRSSNRNIMKYLLSKFLLPKEIPDDTSSCRASSSSNCQLISPHPPSPGSLPVPVTVPEKVQVPVSAISVAGSALIPVQTAHHQAQHPDSPPSGPNGPLDPSGLAGGAKPVPPPGISATQSSIQEYLQADDSTSIVTGAPVEQMQDLDRAVSMYENMQHSPNSIDALMQLADIARIRENYPRAIKIFNRVIDIQKDHGEAWSALGYCYLMQYEHKKAHSAYEQALYSLPDPKKNPRLWYGIGILYDRYGSWDHAEEAFASVLRMDSDFDRANEILFRLGIIYKEQENYSASLDCFERILHSPPNPLKYIHILYQIGDVYVKQKDYTRAKEAYERILSEAPHMSVALQQLGWLHYQSDTPFRDPELAIHFLTKALQVDPSDALSWWLLGQAYMQDEKYLRAYKAYQQAIERDECNAAFWHSIGAFYFQIDQYRDAVDAYFHGIRINPYSPEIWFDLGLLYESCHNQMSDAINACARAAELDPENKVISQRLALLKNARSCHNQMSDAINAYARAAELGPENKVISQRLALLKNARASGGGAGAMTTSPAAFAPQNAHLMVYKLPLIYKSPNISFPP